MNSSVITPLDRDLTNRRSAFRTERSLPEDSDIGITVGGRRIEVHRLLGARVWRMEIDARCPAKLGHAGEGIHAAEPTRVAAAVASAGRRVRALLARQITDRSGVTVCIIATAVRGRVIAVQIRPGIQRALGEIGLECRLVADGEISRRPIAET